MKLKKEEKIHRKIGAPQVESTLVLSIYGTPMLTTRPRRSRLAIIVYVE